MFPLSTVLKQYVQDTKDYEDKYVLLIFIMFIYYYHQEHRVHLQTASFYVLSYTRSAVGLVSRYTLRAGTTLDTTTPSHAPYIH